MFGIAYKPFIKKKEEYSMPKGAAFEDEAEFEKDMIISRVAKKVEEDDEFDIDVLFKFCFIFECCTFRHRVFLFLLGERFISDPEHINSFLKIFKIKYLSVPYRL